MTGRSRVTHFMAGLLFRVREMKVHPKRARSGLQRQSGHDLTPQSAGLLAISMGLRDLSPDDHEVLRRGFVIYDALYAWASKRTGETHKWPPTMPAT